MSQPEAAATTTKPNTSLLIRGAIWIAIGALIAAALVCVVWVLIGNQDGLIGRAFLTILLLAAFAGIAILEASLAPNRADWIALSSMITWIIALLVGAVKIWLPEENDYFGTGAERFFQLLLVIGILQLALLHVRLYTPAAQRYVTVFTRVIYYLTLVFLVALVGLLLFFLTFPHTFEYDDLYWRIVVALAILAAVGTTLIPLLNVLFAPRRQPATAPAVQQWPTYADGLTPLPVLPDGSPDWNAYYTGQPTYAGQPASAAPQSAPALAPGGHALAPGYAAAPAAVASQGYPAIQPAPVWPVQDAAAAPAPAADAAPEAAPAAAAPEQPAPQPEAGAQPEQPEQPDADAPPPQPGAFPPPPPLPPQQ